MIIDQSTCSALAQARVEYEQYLPGAISVVGSLLSSDDEANGSVIARFEILHVDGDCRLEFADACVHVVSVHHNIQFVALGYNYVSYWQPITSPTPGWDLLVPGQATDTHEVCILGQTLRGCVNPQVGAGYLHYVEDFKSGDGWTVNVGMRHPVDVAEFHFQVTVSARPDWTPHTNPTDLVLATLGNVRRSMPRCSPHARATIT